MRETLLILLTCFSTLLVAEVGAQPGQHEHHDDAGKQSAVISGKLVDSKWFEEQKVAKGDRLARASENLANGVPAAVLADERGEKGALWILLANPAVLAPYVGKSMKFEGRLQEGNRAIIPETAYVDDAGTWRQVQLAEPPGKPTTIEPSHGEHSTKPEEAVKSQPAHAEHADKEERLPTAAPEEHKHAPATGQVATESEASAGHHAQGLGHAEGLVLAMPPAHPLLVNFTAGLLPAAVIAEWLGRLFRRRSLTHAAWWMLFFGAAITPLTVIAGWLWFSELGDMGHSQIHVHKWLGTCLAVVVASLAIWRARIHARDANPSAGYLTIVTIVLLAVAIQGHLGATMSFESDGLGSGSEAHEH